MNSSLRDATPAATNGAPPNRNGASHTDPEPDRRPTLTARLVRRWFPRLETPLLISLWDGTEFATAPGRPVARVHFRDRRTLLRVFLDPELGFGDGYSEGRIEVEGDFVTFLGEMCRRPPATAAMQLFKRRLAGWLFARPHANSLDGSRENISHHYDIGNDFYRLWLDERLVYTCAYYPRPDMTLEEAQLAKMDHVCRKLQLRPGQAVVEAGCGWGALALHMARHYGVTVTAFNISAEQVAYARQRAQAEGLAGRVQFVQDDYRNIAVPCDAFVSVGMLEHVGRGHYAELGGVIHRCLKPEGRGLLHFIGRNRRMPTSPWLERRIFPGAYMPSLRDSLRVFEPWDLSVLDVENLRLHYARTLEHWLERFDQHEAEVERMFDRRFVRAWRLYLASSRAAFLVGNVQLFQIVFAGAENNDVPWSREHVYPARAGALPTPKSAMFGGDRSWKAATY
jgi:cyclopropane-fatty-acyl-phospholipid synthase